MAGSYNKITLAGRLTRDPEMRYTASGVTLCNFSLAVNRRFQKDKVDFINCVAWKKLAEICSQYLHKGDMVLVDGELNLDTSDKDGVRKTFPKVQVDTMVMLGSKKSDSNETPSAPSAPLPIPEDDFDVEDIPF